VRSFAAYVDLLAAVRRQEPAKFSWRREAYEFETRHPAVDLLAGSSQLRRALEAGAWSGQMVNHWEETAAAFRQARQSILLYPEAG